MIIRFAQPADAPEILAIYAPFITETPITFEYDIPTVAEFTQRVAIISEQLPYLVAEADRDDRSAGAGGTANRPGRILGYAYASRHRDRVAYQWSVDTSVYIHPDGYRQGIARSLYSRLFELLRQQGYVNAYAGITLPNPGSEAFHRSMGFEPIGVYDKVGYKFGEWHNVGWFALALQPHQPKPVPPISINQLP